MLGSCTRTIFTQSPSLAVATNATVTVRHEDTSALASLYSDADGALPMSNPFTCTTGTFTIYAEGSAEGYFIRATKDAETVDEHHVAIGSVAYLDQEDISIPEMSELGQDILAATTEAEVQQLISVEPGVDVQDYSANLDTLSGTAPSAAGLAVLAAATAALQRTALAIAGKQAIPIPATAMKPRETNGCGAMEITAGAASQPDVPYLPFDGAVKEYASFLMRMPKSWNEGTVTAAFDWRRASGTGAANVVLGMRAVAVSDNETPAVAFGSDATVTDAASTTTANVCLSGETSACTIGGTPSEGDLVLFEVFRDGASGSDTLDSVDLWLTGITLFITTNETNDA